jgi:hypothetical protein
MGDVVKIDAEIRAAVAVDVAFDQHIAVVLHKMQLARLVMEAMRADEVEGLMPVRVLASMFPRSIRSPWA